jgi:hypothetical protein
MSNFFDVARAWANTKPEPKWSTDASDKTMVALAQRFHNEAKLKQAHDRGNENGMGRHDKEDLVNTVYGVTHLG